jgi:hypothetical protein
MATTSPDNIQYPVNSDQVAPLASHFKNLADSTQAALNTKPDTLDLPDVIEKLNNLEYAQFDTTYAGGSTSPGMLAWDADNETLQFQLDDHVTLQVGQEHVIRVKNASGSVAIPNGTVVMFAGAAGDTVTVSPAVSDGSISINYLVGITTEQIPADGFGFVTQLGFVNGVNTNAYNVGDILYPNPAVPGGLTAVEPEAPNWKIPIAAVTKKNASSGRLLVRAIGGGGGGGASVTVEETAPSIAAPGDLWLDSNDGTLYVYYEDVDGNQWIQVQANSALGASIEARLGALESQAIAYGNPNPNVIINGGMDIWQRGTSIAVPAGSMTYTADRWMAWTGSGMAATISRQAGPTGIQYCARVQRNSGNTATSDYNFSQPIETSNSVPLAGKTVTLSLWARVGANFSASSILISLSSGTGTDQNMYVGFTGGASVVSQGISPTTSWQRFSISGAVPASATQLGVTMKVFGVGTAGTNDFFEVAGVQLEQGSTATSFRRNANSIQGELAACQRYYYRITSPTAFGMFGLGYTQASGNARCILGLPTTMRSVPTSLEFSGTLQVESGNVAAACTNVLLDSNARTTNTLSLALSVGTISVNLPITLMANNSINAFIGVTAEL